MIQSEYYVCGKDKVCSTGLQLSLTWVSTKHPLDVNQCLIGT